MHATLLVYNYKYFAIATKKILNTSAQERDYWLIIVSSKDIVHVVRLSKYVFRIRADIVSEDKADTALTAQGQVGASDSVYVSILVLVFLLA